MSKSLSSPFLEVEVVLSARWRHEVGNAFMGALCRACEQNPSFSGPSDSRVYIEVDIELTPFGGFGPKKDRISAVVRIVIDPMSDGQ